MKRNLQPIKRYLVQAIKSASRQLLATARTTVQHGMLGDGAASGDLDRARLLLGRIVRRMALHADVGRVGREDEPVLATLDKCLCGRVGQCDVCDTAQEHDPSVFFFFFFIKSVGEMG